MKNKETKKKTKMQFVRTTDADTAQLLKTCGYTELTEHSSTGYCFINDGKLTFEEDAETIKNIHFTNIICI